MRLLYKFTLSIVILGLAGKIVAQSTEIGGSILIPPSPTPSSIINQIDQDIQLYTGTLNIRIPIHTLQSRLLDVPIYLCYNGAAKKVNDIGSWVGLGWTLNAGGVISRVMHGLPDEYNGTMDLQGRTNLPAKGWLNPEVRGNSGLDIFQYFSNTSNLNRINAIEFATKTGQLVYGGADAKAWDTEPDEFYFNFGKYSGKFIFNKDGAIQIMPAQNLKITKIITPSSELGAGTKSQEITSFEVTDESGNIYTFGNADATTIASLTAVERTYHHFFTQKVLSGHLKLGTTINILDSTGNVEYTVHQWKLGATLMVGTSNRPNNQASYTRNYIPLTSTWHLTKIQSPNREDFIDFTYINEDIKYMTSHNVDVMRENLDLYADYRQSSENPKKFWGTFTFPRTDIDEIGNTITPEGTVVVPFQPVTTIISTAYNSISAKRLSLITTSVGDKVSFLSSTERYDLFGSHRLDGIDIINRDNLTVKSLEFDYEYTTDLTEDVDNLIQVAHYYWFPAPGPNNSLVWFPITEYGLKADANPPPGSITVFHSDWYNTWLDMVECDFYRLFLSKITQRGSGVQEKIKTHEFKYDHTYILPRRLSAEQDHWGNFNSNAVGHLVPRLNYPTYWVQTQFIDTDDKILASGNGQFNVPFRATNVLDANDEPIEPDELLLGANRATNNLRIKAGSLSEIIFPNASKKSFDYGVTSGSLWVNSVNDFPDKNIPFSEKTTYSYSSGSPAFDLFDYSEIWDKDPGNILSIRNDLIASSSTLNFTPFTKGGSIGYARVEESQVGLGKKIYYFKNPTSNPDIIDPTYDFTNSLCSSCPAYAPQTDRDHTRGLLDKSEIVSNSGKILQRVTNTYQINPPGYTPKSTYGLKPGKRFQFNSGNPLDNVKQYAGFYRYLQDFVSMQSQTVETYDQNDPGNETKKIVSTTSYNYVPVDPPGQTSVAVDLMPRRITQTLPNGDKVISETKYPRDYSITPTPTDLAAKGIFELLNNSTDNVPIETISYLERTESSITTKYLLGGTLFKFKEFPLNSEKVYLWEGYKLLPGTSNSFTTYPWSTITDNIFSFNVLSFKLSSKFNNYDIYGQPLSHTVETGIQSDYTWGYNNSLLVNATQNSGSFQHQTSLTHTPLIGVTQITDPNSRSSNYVYDEFLRLKLVKDHDSNIIARYRYHYKDDPENTADFTYNHNPGYSVTFTSTGSYQPGSILTWDFGNGTGKENGGTTETVDYPIPGQYTVTLTVEHPEYPPNTISKILTILPIFSIQITAPTNGSNRTVNCGANAMTTCTAYASGDFFTYQWEYFYSASENSTWYKKGGNSPTLNFNLVGANGSSNSIRCKITDQNGNSRYSSNNLLIWYSCPGQPGGQSDCQPGWVWNATLGRCEPPQGFCNEGCFWTGLECACQ